MSNINTSHDLIIEQLWWVRYFEAPDSVLKGISPGLLNRNDYVISLSKYTNYQLPPGSHSADLNVTLPISLVFTRTEQGKPILAQKTYERSVRPWRVNIHMLVDLPIEFSVKDAIALWESRFWNSPKVAVGTGKKIFDNTHILNTIPMDETKKSYIDSSSSMFSKLNQNTIHLPFVLQSYLLQQIFIEQHQKLPGKLRILIIAQANQVAYFISALSKLLPQQLLRDMTFNTYEHDIQNQQYRICGTILSSEQVNNDNNMLLLASYANDFILNTYAKKPQQLPDNLPPDVSISPTLFERITSYANSVVKFFHYNDINSQEVRNFLQKMESFPDLKVETFLDHYYETFPDTERISSSISINSEVKKSTSATTDNNRPKKSSQKNVEETDNTQTFSTRNISAQPGIEDTENLPIAIRDDLQDMKRLTREKIVEAFKTREGYERLLRDKNSRQQTITIMLADQAWFRKELTGSLANFQVQGIDLPQELIRDINDRAIQAVQEGNEQTFQDTWNILLYISQGEVRSYFLNDLLTKLRDLPRKKGYIFIQRHRGVREHLLNIASDVLQPRNNNDDQFLMEFLLESYIESGELDALLLSTSHGTLRSGDHKADPLRLSPGWNYLLMKKIIATANVEGKLAQIILEPMEHYHDYIRILCVDIAELPGNLYSHKWETLQGFFNVLAENQYKYIKNILKVIVDLPEDLYPYKWETLQNLFDSLMKSQYSNVTSVSVELLDTRPKLPLDVAKNLLKSMVAGPVTLNLAQEKWLFKQYGSLCIQLSPTSPVLWDVTHHALSSHDIPLKWEYMFELVLMLDTLPEDEIDSRKREIVKTFHANIDSPIRLGMLFNLLMNKMSKHGAISKTVAGLGEYACESINARIKKEESGGNVDDAEQGKIRFTMYVQFALHIIDSGDEYSYGRILFFNLLKSVDPQMFDFITDESSSWLPASLRTQWEMKEEERKKKDEKPVSNTPTTAPSPVTVISTYPPGFSPKAHVIGPPSAPVPSSGQGQSTPQRTPAKTSGSEREEEKVRSKLNALEKQEGVRRWYAFYMEHCVILNAMQKSKRITPDEWKSISLACEFSIIYKEADRATGNSLDLEYELLKISGAIKQWGGIPSFDKKEKKRIKLAQQRVHESSQS